MDIVEEVCKDKTVRQYVKGKFLGKGGFAKCYEFQHGEQSYASKIISKASLTRSRARQKLMSEIKIHRSLQHQNVVGFHRYFEDDENVYILLELCTNQTMNELLKRRKRLTELEVQCYLMQILIALQYLHKHNVIHRDLKLGNLFLSDKMEVKLGDFGLATLIEFEGERKRTVCGTPNYIAPEILESKNGHSFEVDIWSFGVIAYTLLVGKPPFETTDVKTTYRRIKMNAYQFPESCIISNAARQLISKILVTEPSKRLTLQEIQDHEFFHGLIPQLLPLSTLACPPSSQYTRQYQKQQSTSIPKFENTEKRPLDLKQRPQYASMDRIPLRSNIESCLNQNYVIQEPQIYVKKWVDYSSKYGLGYVFNNLQCGVFYNDCSKMLMLNDDKYIYIDRNGEEKEGSLQQQTSDMQKKSTLMIHFKGYLIENEIVSETEQQYWQKIYVKKWMKAKHAIIFRLSDKTVQVIFHDNTQIILTQQLKVVTYIDKELVKSTYMLNTALESENNQMVKRLKYTKEILSQMLSGTNGHGTTPQVDVQQPKPLQERANTLSSLNQQNIYSSTSRLKNSLHNK
ncbi:unnamed protein product [Paramecium pentaurelia]|uniref:Serine/threonine-protein kinase PLK n=1 Tax=Paramecium pentaurelia TaxID=43138 RepID=A0A8S1T0H3_9CILI|nr:unnamed protein product [Paramecium pentaurelia]